MFFYSQHVDHIYIRTSTYILYVSGRYQVARIPVPGIYRCTYTYTYVHVVADYYLKITE